MSQIKLYDIKKVFERINLKLKIKMHLYERGATIPFQFPIYINKTLKIVIQFNKIDANIQR